MGILNKLENAACLLVGKAGIVLRKDVERALAKAYSLEKNPKAARAIKDIMDNAKCARKEHLAICQDTGMPIVFIQAGKNVKVNSAMVAAVKKGVISGYKENYFRRSLVDPLKRLKPGYSGDIPIYVEFTNGTGIKLSILLKGFGSENKTKLYMLNPTDSSEKVVQCIVDAVKQAGPESCPPFFLGVGIGGTSDKSLYLSKRALLDKVDCLGKDTLADKILKEVNALKIGPMGLGGDFTCLSVNIRTASTHIAGLPVGVNISCHALRSATCKLDV